MNCSLNQHMTRNILFSDVHVKRNKISLACRLSVTCYNCFTHTFSHCLPTRVFEWWQICVLGRIQQTQFFSAASSSLRRVVPFSCAWVPMWVCPLHAHCLVFCALVHSKGVWERKRERERRRDCKGPKGCRDEKQTYGYITRTISYDTGELMRAITYSKNVLHPAAN